MMLAHSSLTTSLLGFAVLQHIAYTLLAARPLPAGTNDEKARQLRQASKTLRSSSLELLVLLFITWSISATVPGGAVGSDGSVVLILIFIAGRFLAWHGDAMGARRTVGYLLSLLPAVAFAASTLLVRSQAPPAVETLAPSEAVVVSLADAALAGAVPLANPNAEVPPMPSASVTMAEPTTTLSDSEALARYCNYDRRACRPDMGSERQRLEGLVSSMAAAVRADPDRFASRQFRDIDAMAKRNNPVALYQLGMLFDDAASDHKYPVLTRASAAGYGPASYMLGRIDMGDARGPARVHFYRLALEQGYDTQEVRIALLLAMLDRSAGQDCKEAGGILEQLPAEHPIAVAVGSHDGARRCRAMFRASSSEPGSIPD